MKYVLLSFLLMGSSFADGPQCHCDKDGNQIECDETKSEYGEYKCLGDCHCSKGRKCQYEPNYYKNGVCVDRTNKET